MVAIERDPPVVAVTPTADAIPLRLRRRGGTPRQVFVVTLVGALVLAMFASRDLASWLDRSAGVPLLAPVQRAAASWDRAMQQIGLTRPNDALREVIRRLLDWQWDARP